MITGLDHVQVAAPPDCEHEARAFYGGLLGLTELEKPEPLKSRGGAWFKAGPQQLHVGVTPDFQPATKAHPALTVDSPQALNALAERLILAGVDIKWDEAIPGRFYTEDPWGNRLELVSSPSRPTTAR
jgi:catechol 2,3-dioxygenase-like lactoylglutathione lyase family enzyme